MVAPRRRIAGGTANSLHRIEKFGSIIFVVTIIRSLKLKRLTNADLSTPTSKMGGAEYPSGATHS
jgi:hypothetical protein